MAPVTRVEYAHLLDNTKLNVTYVMVADCSSLPDAVSYS